MGDKTFPHVNVDELAQFREVQQLAYRCVESVGEMLLLGMTEKDAARLLTEWLQDHGVRDWLHKPFAWFGDRTAFEGFSGLSHMAGFNLAFFPSSRRLEENMPVILDVAPILNGVIADVGYATCIGVNPILEQLKDDLAEHRELIVITDDDAYWLDDDLPHVRRWAQRGQTQFAA
ncbi:hypothetical protein R69927_01793 [Paraburkholderia domus]|uniref:Peptidase M24 domain-containing protein n=1 Tax=Paraburkholderia domus TaxID=2793075 RepID=A0A9N8MS19_9BURK|nr:M24 family metallopeptidase [Paraburkholderia domus]MBK5048870.1 aminopeptidase P family protein [Burkholderia sp. R-70006]MBK5086461.1 aminopeptidase P family protein [Burkholderia sp. R-69927]MBK5120259.1 aminopeptidase P family protein [Burkholderia sp. R-69980]MBK5165701.1 aminopeptidase P family protein [Burkholderia sp. R-70211]MBK5180026.1 aminopeptidase P family protein [Burkholderia sp. R-69749]